MSEETKGKALEVAATSRRTFVKTAGQVAVTAPAVALLLNATGKSAMAQVSAYQASAAHILDDFTTGNTHEDIDSATFGSNVNNVNGVANQDDHV